MIEYMDVDSLDPVSFARRFQSAARPVIIKGCFAGTQSWTLDYLSGMLTDKAYNTRHYGARHFEEPIYRWSTYCNWQRLTFAQYAELLRDGTAQTEQMYFAQIGIGATAAGASVSANLGHLSARTGLNPVGDISMFLGPARHYEPLHFDLADGTLMQMKGAKHVSLYPPQSARGLYPFPRTGPILPWFAQVDIERPDLTRFPRYAEVAAERIDAVLDEGEVLFIPAFWWHRVTADSPDYVCSINHMWKVEPESRLRTQGPASLAALAHRADMHRAEMARAQ